MSCRVDDLSYLDQCQAAFTGEAGHVPRAPCQKNPADRPARRARRPGFGVTGLGRSQGNTRDEAPANIREATDLCRLTFTMFCV